MSKVKFIGWEITMLCARFRSLFVVGVYFLIGSSVALAQAKLPGLDVTTSGELVDNVICVAAATMFWVLIALSVVFVLVAAYKYLTSGGDAEKVKDATKTITYAAVAIAVALLAKGFPFIVSDVFGYKLPAGC